MPTAPLPDPDFRPTRPLGWFNMWLPDVLVSHIIVDEVDPLPHTHQEPSLVMGEAPTPEPSPLPLTALERILAGLPLLTT